jgi:hypothetical protein
MFSPPLLVTLYLVISTFYISSWAELKVKIPPVLSAAKHKVLCFKQFSDSQSILLTNISDQVGKKRTIPINFSCTMRKESDLKRTSMFPTWIL